FPPGRLVDDAQDVVGAERATLFFRVVIEVNGRQPGRQVIDVTDADQAAAQVVTPFLHRKGIVDERIRAAGGVLGGVLRPTLRLGLKGVVAVVEGELGPRHRRLADSQLYVFVGLAGAALAAVGPEAVRDDAQRPAGRAGAAGGAEEHGAEAPPTFD